MKHSHTSLALSLLVSTCASGPSVPAAPADPQDMLRQRMRNVFFETEGTATGEGVCWHAAYRGSAFLNAYRTTGNVGYMKAGFDYYDAVAAKLHTSPDGYRGWVGPFIYDKDVICDVHVGDAILLDHMLGLAEQVLAQRAPPSLKQFTERALAYKQLAVKSFFAKWDARGTWRTDGPYGAYVSWDHYMTPDRMDAWQKRGPDTKSRLTLPLNKQLDAAIVALRMYRITGDKSYRERGERICNLVKSRMCLFGDHYVWNYWEPFGEWDVDPKAPGRLRHWVNVHPYRDYQAGEVGKIVEAYDTGVTFDADDIRRIVNTNVKVMWNSSQDGPKWRNSDYAARTAATGVPPKTKAPGSAFPKLAGTLWRSLARFDWKIRELGGMRRDTPPSFIREFADLPASTFSTPLSPSCRLAMATALPAHAEPGQTILLVSKTRVPASVETELRAADGSRVLDKIATTTTAGGSDGFEGITITRWRVPDTLNGRYRIRWATGDEFRDFPITVGGGKP